MVLGKVVGVGFLLVTILVAYAVFQPVFAGLIDEASGFFTGTQLKPKIGIDETICNLQVIVVADLRQDINIGLPLIDSKPFVQIVENNIRTQWFDCFEFSAFPTANLIDIQFTNPDPLVILFALDFDLETSIALIDKNDSAQKVDSRTQKQLSRTIHFSAGDIVNTPKSVNMEFVVTKIPQRDFILEIVYEAGFITGINDLNSGEAFVTKVCANGTNLC